MNSSANLSGNKQSGPGWVERIGYGLGCTGITMLFSAISDYIVIYMTDVALLDIAVISTILAVSRFFDGISDLTVGHILDRTSTPLGKARPWLLATCIPFAITGWLLFRVPGGWPSPIIYIYVVTPGTVLL